MMIFIRKYGLWAVLFFCLFLTSLPARDLPGERESHVSELILRAEREKLHEDPYWLLLLHYKRGIAGWRSLIDDPAFFFSPEGKRNSRKEMEATIRAFFSESAGTAIHPAMKFIARYSWLKERLNINESLMALNPVEKFNSYYDSLKLSRVILVFPSGYMGSPASMYGHTLILLEPQNGSRLLSMAVNYAANTEESFGPAFIYRGVFGLYDGFYSFLPYHEKINEYSFGEMRDMWEYRLNLDEGEKRRLVMHLIELEHMKSGYFFFDENCSYNLLFLIEVARPSTAITERFSVPVEPVDTIRAVIDSGLVEKKDYRPSLYSKIRYRADTLDSECDKKAIALARSDEADISFSGSEEAAMTLDLAVEYLQFLAVKNDVTKDEYRRRLMNILKRRNSLDYSGDTLKAMTPPDPPESSHKSNKVSIAGGKFDEEPYVEFRYHPSSNELIDMDRGLSPNSEIMFLNMAFRWYPGEKELLVQRFDVLSIVSLPVSDRFYLNKCWKVRTGMEQVISPELEQELSGFFRTGGGLSAALGFLGQWYVMTDLNFNFAPEFAYSTYNTFGFTSGLITSFGYLWKSHIYGGTGWSFYGDTTHQWEAGMEQMFSPLTNFSLILKCGRFHVFNNDFDEISLRATLFF